MREDLIGTIVEERYLIEQRLGAGAMGRVYRARHTKLGREVAIKILRDDLVREPALVERFEREARSAARLHHPNLVGVLDVGENLMVMELAAGVPLAELIGAPLPRARVTALVAQLLRGLEHAHAAGLVHRDLKPENILVERHADGTETARIVDFGIAVLRDHDATSPEGRRLTDAGLVVGTPLYMSPEQATGRTVDQRTDLFSLGVIVYELLAGVAPFHGTGAEVAYANVTKDPPLIADRARGVAADPLLEAFARRLMARRRDDRFASAHEALAALELIDRDRIAAARAIGLFGGSFEASGMVVRVPHDSDALSTLPMSDSAPVPVIAPEPTVRRSRAPLWALAVLAIGVVAAWALLHGKPANTASAALPRTPAVIELPEPAGPVHLTTTAPAPAVVSTPPVATPARAAVVAPAPAIAQPSALATIAPAIEQPPAVAAPAPAIEQPPVVAPPPVADESAAAVAARYHAVGNALHTRGTDELWQQYRRIQLAEAMATAESRHAALTALDAIERALPAS
jgi:serine/threonine-protein kinase